MSIEAKKPRVALFVDSHEGYGHFNIVSQLARRLEEQGAEVMVLSGTLNYAGAAQTFNFKDSRVVHLPLVDYRIVKGGKWEYTTPEHDLYEESPEYINKRKAVIKEALTDFKPDMVVTEFFPFQQSFRKHDIEAVDELKTAGIIAPQVTSLCRDIIPLLNCLPQNNPNWLYREIIRNKCNVQMRCIKMVSHKCTLNIRFQKRTPML